MSSKQKIVLAICLGCVIVFGYWRYQVGARPRPVAQFGFIQDTSDSIASDCGRMEGLTKRALAMKTTGAGSKITLFAFGTKETANEPRFLGEFEVPVIRRVIEGQRAAAREKQSLLEKVRSSCKELGETKVSPVFQAVKRGVEHMQQTGNSIDERYLFVQTDGEETENPQIKAALKSTKGKLPTLPALIDNKGVHVTFCGIAETIGDAPPEKGKPKHRTPMRNQRHSDVLREVWTKVFTAPELVTFEPYCSR
jgi:hypothetical protein